MSDDGPQISPVGPDDVWVNIYSCPTRQEAVLAVAKLQSLGIPARVDGQVASVLGASWFGNLSPLNAKIQVLKHDAADAKAELDAVDRRRVERMRSVPCPKCGQVNPDRVWPKPRLTGIVLTIVIIAAICTGFDFGWVCMPLFVTGCAALWPYTPRWRCKACDQRWIAPDPDSVLDDEDDSDEEESA